MKKGIFAVLATVSAAAAIANVKFIDLAKISNDPKLVAAFNYIKQNLPFYDHWTSDWTYNRPKTEFIVKLEENYTLFSRLDNKNEEHFLLLGDIAAYLYNLNDSAFYSKVLDNYQLAIKKNKEDFRAYWFIGYFYAVSNSPAEAVANFLTAQQLLPDQQPPAFWNDYAFAALVANMPSHCLFAMEKIRKITGEPGELETQVGKVVRQRVVGVSMDSSYSKKDLWTGTKGRKSTFISRPLGIKILVDSSWIVSLYNYANRQTAFVLTPPTIPNKEGTEIHYTIALIMKVANDTDELEHFIDNFVAQYPYKNKIAFSRRFDKMVAYEIKDKTMYAGIGGAHSYMVGIERDAPQFPGLLLENPATLPEGSAGKVTFYAPSGSRGRFKERIFYAIVLDSCEDIHDQSLAIFKTFFDNQVIIE